MVEYLVDYDKKNLMVGGSEPSGPYKFNIQAENMDMASLLAFRELGTIGMRDTFSDIWNATLIGPDERRTIFDGGSLLIDNKTGKPLEDIVEKV